MARRLAARPRRSIQRWDRPRNCRDDEQLYPDHWSKSGVLPPAGCLRSLNRSGRSLRKISGQTGLVCLRLAPTEHSGHPLERDRAQNGPARARFALLLARCLYEILVFNCRARVTLTIFDDSNCQTNRLGRLNDNCWPKRGSEKSGL